ncbi:MAG TPA: hypothetical protein VKT24_04985 [Rhizomicrobium sp.]|nr:hypothetical protein [Rhizomicrobium sp.]
MQSIRIFVALLVCIGCAGCADLDLHPFRNVRDAVRGEPRINDNVFMLRNGGEADDYADIPAVIPLACLPPDWADKDRAYALRIAQLRGEPADAIARERNLEIESQMLTMGAPEIANCTYAMKLLVDTRWAHFEHVMNASLSTSNFVLDAAVTGLTTAIPLVGSGTKDILGAIAAGISGTRKNFNEDILYSYSIQAILQQMRTDRAEVATRIDTHLTKGGQPYASMYAASIDLFEYDQAGSWDHAMSSLQINIAATTAACQARLRNQQMAGAVKANTTADLSVNSTPTEPCGPAPASNPAPNSGTPALGGNAQRTGNSSGPGNSTARRGSGTHRRG